MSRTLFRLGLWVILVVLAMHVLRETLPESSVAEIASSELLSRAAVLGVLLLAAGGVMSVVRKPKALTTHRCIVCRTPVRKGTIYCRAHLRNMLSDEHDRRHFPRTNG
ncbi:MAG TPA: hypothetical protein VNM92_10820 [Thermoanaerobaculia bacterium]|nr:hypothetical protein [Thermoanaerobaculia bacterium]